MSSNLQRYFGDYFHAGPAARQAGDRRDPVNVNDLERVGSSVLGAVLINAGLRRGSFGGLAVAAAGGALVYRSYTGHCALYTHLGITSAAPAKAHSYQSRGIHVEQSITIDKPADELYAFWRKFDNLPQFMGHLESVNVLDEKTSRWTAKAPAGRTVTWDAEIINDEPGKLIAWRSLAGAQVDNAGSVRFIPATAGRGTEVRVVLDYIPFGGVVGKWVAKLFGEDPDTSIHQDLRKLKMLMEAGVVATIDGQPHGPARSSTR